VMRDQDQTIQGITNTMEFFLSTTTTLISMWVALYVALLMLVAKTDLSINRKMLIVPLTFLLLYVTISDTINLFGYPYDGYPNGEFQIVSHRVDETKTIVLWVRNEDGDRLYRFPYDEKTKKALDKSAKKTKDGVRQMGKFGEQQNQDDQGNRNSSMTRGNSRSLKVYDFPHQERLPKTPN